MELDKEKLKEDYQAAFPGIIGGLLIILIIEAIASINPLGLEYTFGYYMFLLLIIFGFTVLALPITWFMDRYVVEEGENE